MAERIQLSRAKGWRKPVGAVVVSRPSRWGNPYKVGETYLLPRGGAVFVKDAAHAVRLYRKWLFTIERSDSLIPLLRGKDLCCWCPIGPPGVYVPCHADVLLSVANDMPIEVICEGSRGAAG